jgi:hypothetical protein
MVRGKEPTDHQWKDGVGFPNKIICYSRGVSIAVKYSFFFLKKAANNHVKKLTGLNWVLRTTE